VGEAVNGWQVSGYTTYQDGVPYQTTSPNMNMNFQQYHDSSGGTHNVVITQPLPANTYATSKNANGLIVVGPDTYSVGTTTWLGSSQYENGLQPVLTCDPRHGLVKGSTSTPSASQRRPRNRYHRGPGGSGYLAVHPHPALRWQRSCDLQAFKVTESQRFEVRVSATNWLNHPNAGFGINGNADNSLLFNGVPGVGNLGTNADGSVTNSNSTTTGTPAAKLGYRWVQFAGKYYF